MEVIKVNDSNLLKILDVFFSFGYYGHFSFVWKDIVNNYENVWLCTCNYLEFGVVERMVKEIRNDRICWGSDFSDLHFGFTLGPILLSSIDDKIKIKILGENTKNFIKNVIIKDNGKKCDRDC